MGFIFGSILQLDDSLFVCIEVGQSVVVNDPGGSFRVTAFDANHCPGILIFLYFNSVIYWIVLIEFRFLVYGGWICVIVALL